MATGRGQALATNAAESELKKHRVLTQRMVNIQETPGRKSRWRFEGKIDKVRRLIKGGLEVKEINIWK